MILQKYKIIKKLFKGSYADIFLCEDPHHQKVVIRQVSKQLISKDPHAQQQLIKQKLVLTDIKSSSIVALRGIQQDQEHDYFICEHCDGGDLLNYQFKQPNKVFTLKQTTHILSSVIQGAHLFHLRGYPHNNIKMDNILLKHGEKQGEYVYKLSGFKLPYKLNTVQDKAVNSPFLTISNTDTQCSKEDFSKDMWNFGVTFYFLLNMEFPFASGQAQIQQGKQFSYRKSVQQSKKKIMQNCTDDVEDLFKRMFYPEASLRITFSDIKKHSLFKQYFKNEHHKIHTSQEKVEKITNQIKEKAQQIKQVQEEEQTMKDQKREEPVVHHTHNQEHFNPIEKLTADVKQRNAIIQNLKLTCEAQAKRIHELETELQACRASHSK